MMIREKNSARWTQRNWRLAGDAVIAIDRAKPLPALALQLPSFEVGALGSGLVSSAPE
jgi:hypothetical protein